MGGLSKKRLVIRPKVYSDQGAEGYLSMQWRRPDYRGAIQSIVALLTEYSERFQAIRLADYCSGPGDNSAVIAKHLGGLEAVYLYDLNAGFIEQAQRKNITSKQTKAVCGDVIHLKIQEPVEIVLALFAYHHVSDAVKPKLINKMKTHLVSNGLLAVAEIFVDSQDLVAPYYERLKDEIPSKDLDQNLEEFLSQTALATNFEYKVAKSLADRQFKEAGFRLIEEKKIWPTDSSLPEATGTFVQIYTPSQSTGAYAAPQA